MPQPKLRRINQEYRADVVAGENTYLLRPAGLKLSDLRPIFVFHGADGDELFCSPVHTGGSNFRYLQAVAAHGFLCISSDWGGETWGNDTGSTKVTEALGWCEDRGMDVSRVGLYGGSHGGAVAMNFFRLNPGLVKGVVLNVPAVNLDNVYEDLADQQADMDAAYDGDYAANGLDHSPHRFAASLNGLARGRVVFAGDDTSIRHRDVYEFSQLIGWPAEDFAPGGHGDLANFEPNVADWVRVYENLRG